jgi:hypothetical protein
MLVTLNNLLFIPDVITVGLFCSNRSPAVIVLCYHMCLLPPLLGKVEIVATFNINA